MTSNMTYPMVTQPTKMKIQLYPHQRTAIYYMELREKTKKNCI